MGCPPCSGQDGNYHTIQSCPKIVTVEQVLGFCNMVHLIISFIARVFFIAHKFCRSFAVFPSLYHHHQFSNAGWLHYPCTNCLELHHLHSSEVILVLAGVFGTVAESFETFVKLFNLRKALI